MRFNHNVHHCSTHLFMQQVNNGSSKHVDVFFYKPSSKPSSKSFLFFDIFLSHYSAKNSLIVP